MRRIDNCPVCGLSALVPFSADALNQRTLHTAQDRCGGCGLLISQPQAEEAEIEAFYRSGYYEEQWPDGESNWTADSIGMLRRDVWPTITSLGRGWLPETGRALEVGCGYGAMSAVLSEHGFRVVGTELSERAATFCRSKGLSVAIAKTLPVRPRTFDLVVARHVIEHVTDPAAFTRTLVEATRPGGVVVVETEHNWIAQYVWDRARARLRGRAAPFRTAKEHTFVFGARHLESLLSAAGCSEVRSMAFAETPAAESLHWRFYKGLFRAIDRMVGWGGLVMAVGKVAA